MIHHIPRRLMLGNWRAAPQLFLRKIRRFAGLIARSLGNSAAATTPTDVKIWRYAAVCPNSVEISALGSAPSDARAGSPPEAGERFRRYLSEVPFRGVLPPMSFVTSEKRPLKTREPRDETFLGLERSN
jgi:hypothetical protein